MRAFLMHVGHPGNIDIDYTVTRRRSFAELLDKLPSDAMERDYFARDRELRAAFPDGTFNCWGLPSRAEPPFQRTQVGDLVLMIPQIGIHDGGVHQLGIVKAKAHMRSYEASRVLWPDTPNDRLIPFLFFFDTEGGFRFWYDFLDDIGYDQDWDPRGYYRSIASHRFNRWGGETGYLDFLRRECGFQKLDSSSSTLV